ncbi:MAG: C45 family peptidase [Myxococcota bacterium]
MTPKGYWLRAIWSLCLLAAYGCGPPSIVPGETSHGRLSNDQGYWLLELDGTPEQRGSAMGTLLKKQIQWVLPRYLRETLRTSTPEGYPLQIVKKLESSIPTPHLRQLDAVAKAAGVERDYLLIANLAPEVWAGLACSCLAATDNKSADGKPILARNLDWFGGSVLTELGMLVVEHGPKRSFASVSYPGLIGVVSGMNESGLSGANLVVLGEDATPVEGVPVMFALRTILETSDTTEQATEMLRGLKRTVPQNYTFADVNKAVVLETWTTRFRRREPEQGFVAVANLFDEDKEIRPNSRFKKMTRHGLKKTLDLETLKGALQEVAMGDMNVQSVIFQPNERLVHFSTRARPAAKGPFQKADLSVIFSSNTKKPNPRSKTP